MNQIGTDKTLTNLNTLRAKCTNIDEDKTLSILNEMYAKCANKEEMAALTIAMKAVRKEIRTQIQYVSDGLGGSPFICPSCGDVVYTKDWTVSRQNERYRSNRCVKCGQCLNWSTENIKKYEGETVYSPIR